MEIHTVNHSEECRHYNKYKLARTDGDPRDVQIVAGTLYGL